MAEKITSIGNGKGRKVLFLLLALGVTVAYAAFMWRHYTAVEGITPEKKSGFQQILYRAVYGDTDPIQIYAEIESYTAGKSSDPEFLPGLYFLKIYLTGDDKRAEFNASIADLQPDGRARLADDIEVCRALLDPANIGSPRLISVRDMTYPLLLVLYYKQFSEPVTFSVNRRTFFYIQKKLGIYCHDNQYAKAALEVLRTIKSQPGLDDPEVDAWLGSATTMMALEVDSVVKKLKFVNQGIELIDQAARRAPANIIVKFVRVYNCLSLPQFFNRSNVAYEDLINVWESYSDAKPGEYIDEHFFVQLKIPEKEPLLDLFGFAARYAHFDTHETGRIIEIYDRLKSANSQSKSARSSRNPLLNRASAFFAIE